MQDTIIVVKPSSDKPICRHQHVSNKDHNVEPEFCPKPCKAYVETNTGNICKCCGGHIDKTNTWIEAKRIYNKLLTKYGPLIERLENDPELQQLFIDYPMLLRIKHGSIFTYTTE